MAQMVKRLPAMRETWVRSLGREDPLDKEMVILYAGSILGFSIVIIFVMVICDQ